MTDQLKANSLSYFESIIMGVAGSVLGVYAIAAFNTATRIIGIAGLIVGVLFFRPGGYRRMRGAVSLS